MQARQDACSLKQRRGQARQMEGSRSTFQGALSPPPGESDPSCGVAGVSTDVQYFDRGWKQST